MTLLLALSTQSPPSTGAPAPLPTIGLLLGSGSGGAIESRAFTSSCALSSSLDSAYSISAPFTGSSALSASFDSQYQVRAAVSSSSILSASLDSQYRINAALSSVATLTTSLDSQYQVRASFSAAASLSAAFDAIDGASGEVFASFTSSAALTVSLHSQYEETAPRPSRPHKPRGAGFYQSITGLRIPAAFNAKVSLRASLDSAIQINGTTSSEQVRELQSASQLRMNLVAVPLYANKGLIRTYAPRIYQLERV